MGEEEGAVVRQIAKERKRKTAEKCETNTKHKICFEKKNTEKGETNTGHKYVLKKESKRKNTEKGETNSGHKYVLNSIQVHMLVPKTKLSHLSGKGRLTGEQVDAIKRDLQVSFKHLKVSKCTIVVLGILCPIFFGIWVGLLVMPP